jgi:hypothetical protein
VWKHRRLRLVCAAILRDVSAMARQQPIRLRETPGRPVDDTQVIDAKFVEVGAKRRTLLGRIGKGLMWITLAAAVGFLIPPAWIVVQEIGAMFEPVR